MFAGGRSLSSSSSRDLLVTLALACPAGALVAAALTAAPYASPDTPSFLALARSLQQGLGFVYREPMMPDLDLKAFRSPAYAAFLAGALATGGVQVALALQGALAGATAVLLADLARRVAGMRVAVITLAAHLFWGQPWRNAGELMTETLYAFFVVLVLWLAAPFAGLTRAGEPGDPRPAPPGGSLDDRAAGPVRALLLGLTLALAILTRPSGFSLAIALGLVLAHRAPRALAIAATVAVLAWAPWPVRNAVVLHAFVPSLTNGGLNAWNGNTGRPITEGWKIQAANAHRGEIGLDRMFWRLAREEITAHPRAAADRLARRVVWCVWPPSSRPEQWLLLALWPLAAIGVWGLAAGPASARSLLGLAGAAWACHALMMSLIVVNERYRFPTDSIVVLVGAFGVETLLSRLGARRGAAAAAALGIGFAALVTLVRPLI
jgi:hypothetical protein